MHCLFKYIYYDFERQGKHPLGICQHAEHVSSLIVVYIHNIAHESTGNSPFIASNIKPLIKE